MTWQGLLAARRVQPHKTSLQEINDLRAVVARDLADAAIAETPADRRFAVATNAALQLARVVLACRGYKTAGSQHHRTAFDALEAAMAPSAATDAATFGQCRRKRSIIDYDTAFVASESEAASLLQQAAEFGEVVEDWIRHKHARVADTGTTRGM
jgi:hypothetical protein